MLNWLKQRETFLKHSSILPINVTCGLKSYHLQKIIPQDAAEDIFLGFSTNACYLLSYKADFKCHVIRFWLFPPRKSGDDKYKLELFAERKFSRMTYTSRLQETPCVRFIQSFSDSNTFFFLACDNDGTGLVSAFGLMPVVDCPHCVETSLCFNRAYSGRKLTCPVHDHVLPLNLDLPNINDYISVEHNDSSDLLLPCGSSSVKSKQEVPYFTPPCLKLNHLNCVTCDGDNDQCSCFASTASPIGRVQVGVCPNTGSLRVAWASPDAQVKVISCSFKIIDRNSLGACVFPQGTMDKFNNSPISLAYMTPLLTHNYCSTCYSWPDDGQKCHGMTGNPPKSFYPNSAECVFSQKPPRVYLVHDSSSWLDNHTSPSLVDPQKFVWHQCYPDTTSQTGTCCQKSVERKNCWVRSLLCKRASILSCTQVTYLAMLQDIRASYVHWALISRSNNLPSYSVSGDTPAYPVYQSRSSDDDAVEWNDETSSGASPISSDDEPVAIMSSPLSLDCNISPEDLIAHRLSGQCHTSFDLSDWQEYGQPVNSKNVNNLENKVDSVDEVLNNRVFAHLEEVVFDMPIYKADENEPLCNNFSPLLFVFIPHEEPNLLLVYHMKTRSSLSYSNMRKLSTPSSLSSSYIYLVGAIDLATGYQFSPHQSSRSLNSQHLSQKLSFEILQKITSCCPQLHKYQSMQSSQLYELNNCLMVCRSESLKLLVDPLHGYSVYW